MQAAVQRHVDSAISKTVNVPADISFAEFQEVYLDAYRSGCKGCTTYRPNAITGSVLAVKEAEAPAIKPPPAPRAPIDLMLRSDKLSGATYKLRWPDSEHAMYVTINDTVQDGIVRPFEDLRELEEPGTLRLGGGADPDDQRRVPARRRSGVCRQRVEAGYSIRAAASGAMAGTCRPWWRRSATSSSGT